MVMTLNSNPLWLLIRFDLIPALISVCFFHKDDDDLAETVVVAILKLTASEVINLALLQLLLLQYCGLKVYIV